MRIPSNTGLLALLTWAATVQGDVIQEDLSFGAHGSVWTDDHREVTGFNLGGEAGHVPELLSDRIVMTPPWPGNKRASLWADHPEPNEEWIVDLTFRATGPDHASGNMNIWYVHSKDEVGTASIYTVGKFDGLAIIIDQYGGKGGSIRGFLNDGSKSYKDHHHVDSLSFGQCDFAYRNTGRFIEILVKQSRSLFEVTVDGKSCFKTHKVKVPRNYFLGLTAASADNPDSFEVKSFIVRFPGSELPKGQGQGEVPPPGAGTQYGAASHHDPRSHSHDGRPDSSYDSYKDKGWYWTDEKSQFKDAEASTFKSEKERFQDLHDRVQLLNHQIDIMFHDISMFKEQQEERHKELIHWLAPIHDFTSMSKHIMERLEVTLTTVQHDVELKEFKEHLSEIRVLIGESHMSLLQHLPASIHNVVSTSSPRFGFFVFLIVVSQVMLLGSYMIYKRRQDMQPKKYL